MSGIISSMKYTLTPASYGVRRQIDNALKEILLEMSCAKSGLFSRGGIFKEIAWSIVGEKNINRVTTVTVTCSDSGIQEDYRRYAPISFS